MKVSKDFDLTEFIDPDTYKQYGDSSIWFIDRRIIIIAQFIRDRFNYPGTINNWAQGGCVYKGVLTKFVESGFRPETSTIGAPKGQHRYGRAEDYKMIGYDPLNGAEVLREDIIKNFSLYNELGLTTIEAAQYAPDWCHLDTRWTNLTSLFIVKP